MPVLQPSIIVLLSAVSCRSTPEETCEQRDCGPNAPEVDGHVIFGGADTGAFACAVDHPYSSLALQQAISDWCAGSGYTAGGYHGVDLQSCTDRDSAQYLRAEVVDYCCTDIYHSSVFVWTPLGVLVYSNEQEGLYTAWCCCGKYVSELIYGAPPGLTCGPADRAALCE